MAESDRTMLVSLNLSRIERIILVTNSAVVVLRLCVFGPSFSDVLLIGVATFSFAVLVPRLLLGAATILPTWISRYFGGRLVEVLSGDAQAVARAELADPPTDLFVTLNGVQYVIVEATSPNSRALTAIRAPSQMQARPTNMQPVRAEASLQARLHQRRVVLEPIRTDQAPRYRIPTGVFRVPDTPSTASTPSPFIRSRAPDARYQTQATEQPAAVTQAANPVVRRCMLQTECNEPYIKNVTDFPPRFQGHNHDSNICNECMQSWLEFEIANTVPCRMILCPEVGCGKTLSYHEIQRFATPALFERYSQAALRDAMNDDPEFRHCPSGSCTFGQMHPDNPAQPLFECNACGYRYCVKCAVPWHQEMSCTGYQERIRRQEAARQQEARRETARQQQAREEQEAQITIAHISKRCPCCGWDIEMNGGCNHITCRCRHQWCWLCGENWIGHPLPLCPLYGPAR